MKTRVLIVLSDPMTLKGLESVISVDEDIETIGTSLTGKEGVSSFRELTPDVLILGLRLPDMCAADDLIAFIEVNPEIPILVYSADPGDVETTRSLEAGAAGFVTADMSESEIVSAIRLVSRGKKFLPESLSKKIRDSYLYEDLTDTELEVLRMIVGGLANKEIAFALDVSQNTVKTHIKHIFEKLHVNDRTSASVVAIKRGLVRIDI